MNAHERPTPETFAALVDHMPEGEKSWSHHYLQLSSFARRLERERDEARDCVAELEKRLAELQKPKERETFQAHGLTWIKHTPGNPMPCYGDAEIRVLLRCSAYGPATSSQLDWSEKQGDEGQIIGWNYADAP